MSTGDNIQASEVQQQAPQQVASPLPASQSDYVSAFDGIDDDGGDLRAKFPAISEAKVEDLRSSPQVKQLTEMMKQQGLNRRQAAFVASLNAQLYANGQQDATDRMAREYEEYQKKQTERAKKLDEVAEETKTLTKAIFEQSGEPVSDEELATLDDMVHRDPRAVDLFLKHIVQKKAEAVKQKATEEKMQNESNNTATQVDANNTAIPVTDYVTSSASPTAGAYGYEPVGLKNWQERGDEGTSYICERVRQELAGNGDKNDKEYGSSFEACNSLLQSYTGRLTSIARGKMDTQSVLFQK